VAFADKDRPVVVISSAAYHAARPDVIVNLLTSDVDQAVGPTDYILQDWQAAGLHRPTAFRVYINTIKPVSIGPILGQLSDRDRQEVQKRLRLALAV
jgi:mRNA interferase MazF